MKAVVIDQYGGPEMLQYRDMPDPVAGSGEVLVRLAAAGVNPVDAMDRSGGTKDWRPLQFPAVIGWDLSGKVVAVGDGVTDLVPGDAVLGWAFHTYAELVAVSSELLVKLPSGMNLTDAAALPLVTMTGSQLISAATDLQAGQAVLVSGAVGSVGRTAVFTAKDRGAHVVAAVRGQQEAEARTLGADRVVALDDEAAMAGLEPVDVVANTVRGDTAEQLLNVVKPGGMFASVTGAPATAATRPDVKVVAFVSRPLAATLTYAVAAVQAGKLAIPIAHRIPLREARRAHELLVSGTGGKILLLPE